MGKNLKINNSKASKANASGTTSRPLQDEIASWMGNRSWRFIVINAFCITSSCSVLWAQPQDATVKAGKASFDHINPSTLQIKTGDKSIINWGSFSIADKEATQFIQPSKHSAVLNRVTGDMASLIDGKLLANGRVYLVNPNGVLIGANGVINTAGFVASSLDVLDADFLNKGELLFTGSSMAKVQNFGKIEVSGGGVVLIGYFVENKGTISAPEGTAALAAGSEVLLKLEGDESIAVHIKKDAIATDETGIENSGSIEALKAELKADGNLYAKAINHSGSIQALGIVEKGGRVLLVAEDSNVNVSGSIAAKNADGTGGDVHLLGKRVGLVEQANIDVSAEKGGGTILVGGDFQGKNPDVLNSQMSYVGQDVRLNANATENGDGGKIIVWSDGATYAYGNIEAKGGLLGGKGGFVETSGKGYLDYRATVDLRAFDGTAGTLLLDPTDMTISSAVDANLFTLSPPPNYLFEPAAPMAPGLTNLSTTTLTNALNLANVTVQTINDTGAGSGDITWLNNSPIPPAGTIPLFTLTIDALRDFTMGSTYNANSGGFIVNAGRDITLESLGTTPTASPGINVSTGPVMLNAARDVNFLATAFDVVAQGQGTSLLAGRNINLQGGSSSTNPARVLISSLSSSNVTMQAGDNISMLGGSGSIILYGINITSSADLNISADRGDITITAGSFAGTTPISITSEADTNILAKGGSLYISGNQDSVLINPNKNMNINVAENFILTGGSSSRGFVSILPLGQTNIIVGNNCILQGGTGDGGSGPGQQDSVTINGFNGVNVDVGNNLLINGGLTTFSYASIQSFSNLSINVGKDITMTAGIEANAFTQIGATINGGITNTPFNINVALGGDLTLNGSSSGVSQAYSMIGNGGVLQSGAPISGNITITGSSTSSLTLNAGSTVGTDSFAQIGHFNNSLEPTSGNININNFGGPVSLNSNGSYALIGHGNDTTSATTITGDIAVTGIGGNLTLNTDINGGFTQIGHINSTSTTIGDVTVSTAGNATLSINPSDATVGTAIIGHGNQFSPSSTILQGNISLAADSITLTAGNISTTSTGISSDAVIGFSTGINVIAPSSVTVTAQNNILMEGGSGTGLKGNAYIGYLDTIGTNVDSIVLNDVSVTAGGDITLVGNTSYAFIGARSTNAASTIEANVTVDAQGILGLSTAQSGGTAGSGFAVIANGATANPVSSIYDVTINAGTLQLVDVPTFSTGLGLAEIFSTRNLNITTTGDLLMNTTFGSGMIHNGPGTGVGSRSTMTFDIGGNVKLLAGSGTSTTVQIGNSIVQNGAYDILFTNIGGDLVVNAGSNVQNFAQIGHIPSTTSLVGDILFEQIGGSVYVTGGAFASAYGRIGHGGLGTGENISGDITFGTVGGNINLTGGQGVSATTAFAQIGHYAPEASTSNIIGNVLINNVGGAVNVTAGISSQADAVIGHVSVLPGIGLELEGQISIDASSFNLSAPTGTITSGGTTAYPANAIIGFDANGANVTSSLIQTTALNDIVLNGGDANGTAGLTGNAIIGLNVAVIAMIDKINVLATNGDILLTGGAPDNTSDAGGNAVIGYLNQLAGSGSSVTINNLNVGSTNGNIALLGGQGGSSNYAFIGTMGALTTISQSNIAINAPLGVLSLTGLPVISSTSISPAGVALISNNSSTVSAPFDITINASEIDLIGIPTQPNDSSFSGSGSALIYSSSNLSATTTGDLNLTANSNATAGAGIANIYNTQGLMSFDIGGNVSLSVASGSTFNSYAQIGTIAPNGIEDDILFSNIGKNLTLTSGAGEGSYTQIGHGTLNTATTLPITGRVQIAQIGGAATLTAGSGTSSYAIIGHVAGGPTAGLQTVQGDIIVENVAGPLNLVGGTGQDAVCVIGHYGVAPTNTDIGQIIVQADQVNLTANGDVSAATTTTPPNVTIGFDLGEFSTINSSLISVSGTNGVSVTSGYGGTNSGVILDTLGNATIGINVEGGEIATIETLRVSSTNGDITLTAIPTEDSDPSGNAVIGYYNALANTNPVDVLIQNIEAFASTGNITLLGGWGGNTGIISNGVAVIGTQSFPTSNNYAASNISIQAPFGLLTMQGTQNANSDGDFTTNDGLALIANLTNFSTSPLQSSNYDISINVNEMFMFGANVTTGGLGAAQIISGRNIDAQIKGDLSMIGGDGSVSILTSSLTPSTISLNVGSNLTMQAGSQSIQIGSLSANETNAESDVILTNVGGNVTLTGGTAAGAYARIGLGSSQASNGFSGQVNVNQVGGNIVLTGGSTASSFAQIGHGASTLTSGTVISGDVIITNVAGEVVLNSGNIGYAGGNSGSISGEVAVDAVSITLNGGGTLNSTIGFDLDAGSNFTSTGVSATATNGITLNGGAANSATIGALTATTGTINQLSVNSTNGDIVLIGGNNTSSPSGDAVIGYYNPTAASATNVTVNNLNVASSQGNVFLQGGASSTTSSGTAIIGTQGNGAEAGTVSQSQLNINAPLGNLSLNGSTGANTSSAFIANNFLGGTAPFDTFINVAGATLNGNVSVGGTGNGTVEIYTGRNLYMQTTGGLFLTAGAGNASIQCGTNVVPSIMTFDIGGSLELVAGTNAASIAQIGNPLNSVTGALTNSGDIVFKNIGSEVILTSGATSTSYARIGHGSTGQSQAIAGEITIDQVGGNLMLLGNPSYAQIGHYGADAAGASTTGDIYVSNVVGDVVLNSGNIGFTGGDAGSFSGEVAVTASSITVNGGNATGSLSSTIGFDTLDTASTFASTQVSATAANTITLNAGSASDATIGAHMASGGTINTLTISSAEGDIVLLGSTVSSETNGNAVIGFFNPTNGEGAVISDLVVNTTNGGIFLTGGFGTLTNGTAFIGTYGQDPTTLSDITISAPNGTLSLFGSESGSAFALISNTNSSSSAFVPLDVSITVNKAAMTGTPVTGSGNGTALIYSGRDLDFKSFGDLNLTAGFGQASIQNSSFNGNTTTMSFDIGGSLVLNGGINTSVNCFAQIGNALPRGGRSDILFSNIATDALLNGGSGQNGYAKIGHGIAAESQDITGDVVIDHIGGDLLLSGGSTTAGNYAQIGHYGADTGINTAVGNVYVNNVAGLIQITAGDVGCAALIGHNAGSAGSSFAGEVTAQGNSIALIAGNSNATIGYDINPAAVLSSLTSSLISASASQDIALTGGSATVAGQGDATIGVIGSLNATISKVNVSTNIGDIVLLGGATTPAANAVIGYYNPTAASATNVTVGDLNVASTQGSIFLQGGANSTTSNGNAIIGTQGGTQTGTVSQSQLSINAPLGNLTLNGSTGANTSSALVANNVFGGIGPFDMLINVASATLNGNVSIGGTGNGTAEIYTGRNLYMQTTGGLFLTAGAGNASIQCGTNVVPSIMTFDIGGSLELVAGSSAASIAQIGNPLNSITGALTNSGDIVFKNIGSEAILTSGATSTSYARIGHGSTGQSQAIAGEIAINQVGGNLMLLGNPSYAQIGHYGADAAGASTTGDIIIRNVAGNAVLDSGNIGFTGGDAGSFSGEVSVKASSITVNGGNIDGSLSSTIGFDTLDIASTFTSTQVSAKAANTITVNAGSFSDATIGAHMASGGTINTLTISSTEGDIVLLGGNGTSDTSGNAVIGFFNPTNGEGAVISDLGVNTTNGGIFLTGGIGTLTNGTAFIGTYGQDATTQSDITISALNGTLSLMGSEASSAFALISNTNSSTSAFVPLDVSIRVNKASMTGTPVTGTGNGTALIYSGRDLDFKSFGDLNLTAGFGEASIQNSSFNGNTTTISFDIGGSLVLNGGINTSMNCFAQIGNPLPRGGRSDILFSNIATDVLLNGGTGMNGYARIGHGTPLEAQDMTGDVVIDQIGGDLLLTAGSTTAGNYAQIGHYGADTGSDNTTLGNVYVNNVAGLIQVTAGDFSQCAALIGHNGGSTSSTFTGAVVAKGNNIALFGGNSNATIGFDTISGAVVQSPLVQVVAPSGITLNGGTTGDATIGVTGASTATVAKLSVVSTKGDLTMTAGSNTTGANAVVGYYNSANAASVNINDLSLYLKTGSVNLFGGGGTSDATGVAFLGTLSGSAATPTSSQITITAPLGTLGLYGEPEGTAITGGSALIANGSGSLPFDISINVNNALLNGTPLSSTGIGSAEIYTTRNLNFESAKDITISAGSGSASISNGFGGTGTSAMTFTAGGNVSLLAGSNASSFAQIGNVNPPLVGTSAILFKKIGGNLLLQGGSATTAYAQIGHFESNGTSTLIGDVQVNRMGGDVTLIGGSNTDSYALIGHFGQNTGIITGNVSVNNVQGNATLTAGSGTNASSVIGHLGKGTAHAYNGQVLLDATSANLQGGSNASSATVGFEDNSTNAPTVKSKQVQVSTTTSTTLTGGSGGNAVIGCYNNTQTGGANVVINNVNVLSNNGDITLQGGTAANSNAVIGTQWPNGISYCNIKLKTTGNVLLENPPGSIGSALIVNNRQGVSGSTNISIDPGNIILLSGTGTPATVQIYSANNIDLVFSNRFDLNFDVNTLTPQTGTAQVLANNDININFNQLSSGNIMLVGPSTAGQSTEITSLNGNIAVGTPDAFGAQTLNISNATGVGIARVYAPSGAVFLNLLKDVSLIGGAAQAEILALDEITINAGRDLDVQTSSSIANTSTFPLLVTTGNDLNMSGTGLIQSSNGQVTLTLGRDLNMSGSSSINDGGNYPLQIMAANDINVTSGTITQTGNAELTAVANKNMTLTSGSISASNNVTLVVDNEWQNPIKFGTNFIDIDGGFTISSLPNGIIRIFTSRQPLNAIAGSLNGGNFSPGTMYVNSATNQWLTYWDSTAMITGGAFTVFYKDAAPPVPPPSCVTICNPCCTPAPAPPPPPHPHPHPHPPLSANEANKAILEGVDRAFYEALQDWRTYDYFLFTPLPIAVNSDCCGYVKQLYPYRSLVYSCEDLLAMNEFFGPMISCQTGDIVNAGMIRPEHRNYHTKKLEIIR